MQWDHTAMAGVWIAHHYDIIMTSCTHKQYRALGNAVGPYGYGWGVDSSSHPVPRLTVSFYDSGVVDPERRLYNLSNATIKTGISIWCHDICA